MPKRSVELSVWLTNGSRNLRLWSFLAPASAPQSSGQEGFGCFLPGRRAGEFRCLWAALPSELRFAQKCDQTFVPNV